jgi:hypothetical protein
MVKRSSHALLAGWQGKAAGFAWNANARRDSVGGEGGLTA